MGQKRVNMLKIIYIRGVAIDFKYNGDYVSKKINYYYVIKNMLYYFFSP